MGRPLNKRNFTTAAAGATAGKNEIKVHSLTVQPLKKEQ